MTVSSGQKRGAEYRSRKDKMSEFSPYLIPALAALEG